MGQSIGTTSYISWSKNIQKITILPQNEFTRRFGNEKTTQGVVLKTKDFTRPGLEEFVKVESKKAKHLSTKKTVFPTIILAFKRSIILTEFAKLRAAGQVCCKKRRNPLGLLRNAIVKIYRNGKISTLQNPRVQKPIIR